MNLSCGRLLCISLSCSFSSDGLIHPTVLHLKYQKKWFNKARWDDEWVDTLVCAAREVWWKTYLKLVKEAPRSATLTKSSSAFSLLDAPITHTTTDPFEDFINGSQTDDDPLAYWTAHIAPSEAVSMTPTEALARMALDFLSAPATSTDVECLFSNGGLVVSK